MRDGAECWWEGKQKEGKSELGSFDRDSFQLVGDPSPPLLSACCSDERTGLVSTRAKSADLDEGHTSHLDTSQHPALCWLAQVANDANEVEVVGSNLPMDTLPRLGEPPVCNQGAPWTV